MKFILASSIVFLVFILTACGGGGGGGQQLTVPDMVLPKMNEQPYNKGMHNPSDTQELSDSQPPPSSGINHISATDFGPWMMSHISIITRVDINVDPKDSSSWSASIHFDRRFRFNCSKNQCTRYHDPKQTLVSALDEALGLVSYPEYNDTPQVHTGLTWSGNVYGVNMMTYAREQGTISIMYNGTRLNETSRTQLYPNLFEVNINGTSAAVSGLMADLERREDIVEIRSSNYRDNPAFGQTYISGNFYDSGVSSAGAIDAYTQENRLKFVGAWEAGR